MEYTPEEYTKFYMVQALFKLMSEYDFETINITDIARKAGVGRATFYRYFKRKEDILIYYFEHNTKEFIFIQRFVPRCREDYIKLVNNALALFEKNKEPFKLLRKARLEYIYLDYLNRNFIKTFECDYPDKNKYLPYLYAGMLFNVSMHWLDNDCKEPKNELADMIVASVYSYKQPDKNGAE